MASIIQIAQPSSPENPLNPSWKAFFSMAFRPFYLLAALQGSIAILFWALNYSSTIALPAYLWHAHEMIWGYTGAIIVGFLLTAVATWTGQPPTRGMTLAGLVLLWILARILLILIPENNLWGGFVSVMFFLASAAAFAGPIIRSRNRRNYGAPLLLIAFGCANLLFHLGISGISDLDPLHMLHVGLLLIATIIFFMGMRVIPFFTSRALNIPQVTRTRTLTFTAIGSALVMAFAVAFDAAAWSISLAGCVAAVVNLYQLIRWWHPHVFKHPLLWVLFAGYACTASGIGLYAFSQAFAPFLISAALHTIAVGGIGLLTLGMMTRTALGHTGRPLKLPPPLYSAYLLILLATLLRVTASLPLPYSGMLLIPSALCFACGFILFIYRYGPWLIRPRADGHT